MVLESHLSEISLIQAYFGLLFNTIATIPQMVNIGPIYQRAQYLPGKILL